MSTISEPAAGDPSELAGRIRGRVVAAGDPGWDEARAAWNLAVDQNPALVAEPLDAAEVAAVISHARDRGLRVAPQSTGHNASPLGSLEGTVLLKTGAMRSVEVDPGERIARVGGGATWGDVVAACAPHGLAPLAGSSHDVGVVGYTLGGGVSWLARAHGLACNKVRRVELVTADGRVELVDAEGDPDLFWALRGGGGNFGVVTSIELELLDLPEVHAGALFFPLERAAEVLEAWRDWTSTTPDELTSIGRLLRLPPFPEIPEPIRGRAFVIVEACHLGPAEEADELLAPLRALGPEMDTFETMPSGRLLELHMDPPQPVPALGDGLLLDDLTPELIREVAAIFAGEDGGVLIGYEFRQLGGALAATADGAGALGGLDGTFLTYGVGMVASAEAAAAIGVTLAKLAEALTPGTTGRRYMNFAEQRIDAASMFGEADLIRLRDVRRRLDPELVLRVSHPID